MGGKEGGVHPEVTLVPQKMPNKTSNLKMVAKLPAEGATKILEEHL